MNDENNSKSHGKKMFYMTALARPYHSTNEDMDKDVSVPVTPERLAQAVAKCGAKRRKD